MTSIYLAFRVDAPGSPINGTDRESKSVIIYHLHLLRWCLLTKGMFRTMKTTFEEIASNRRQEKEMPSPIRGPVHLPLSIKIPEILEYLECADFEHWLTAAFFENANRMPLRHLRSHGHYPSEIRSVNVWMVEITQRIGKIWSGKVQVEITEVGSSGSKAELSTGHRYAELYFTLDTESAEFAFVTDVDGKVAATSEDPLPRVSNCT
jgi:hypothetical protein